MRRATENTEAVNFDSFLDIVASVVSIMIIMVVMEGLRIKNTPVKADVSAIPETIELKKDLEDEASLRKEIAESAKELNDLGKMAAIRTAQRDMLAEKASAITHVIDEKRRSLDGQQKRNFEVVASTAELRRRIDEVESRRRAVETAQQAPVVLASYPTPISRAVDDSEAHFMISGNCVIRVPMEELLAKFKEDARRKMYKLTEQPEVTETIGPESGFRMKYTLERHDVSPEEMRSTGRGGSYARLQKWLILPVDSALGEPPDAALRPNSDFHQALSKYRAGRHTITLWVYPDSFAAFRMIRDDLYQRGYATAARPLPAGMPISGSPDGSKSAAQ